MSPKILEIYEPGYKFGKWTVVSFVGYKFMKGAVYECECECGTKKEILAYIIHNQRTNQCKRCAIKISRKGSFNGKL